MKTVVFFGDSITEFAEQRNGYIDILHSLLKENSLDKKYKLIGSGWRGDKVSDLIQRQEEDVISYNPDLVFIYVGINDVWHFPPIKNKEREELFKNNYQSLLATIENNTKAEPILCTLSVIGERKSGNS